MDNEQIKKTIEHFKDIGDTIRVRDIAYTLLSKMFADSKTAYQCLFSGGEGYDEYHDDGMREKLEQYLSDEGYIRSISTDDDTGEITFEENKKEMERLLAKTQKAMDDGVVDPKDALKIMADIRVKLNDKFKVEQTQKDRLIVVNAKYNSVCEHCHHEIYIPTIEDLKKEYNLIENPNNDGRQQ
jgi:thiol-disulfide isomerase/thioredoxin